MITCHFVWADGDEYHGSHVASKAYFSKDKAKAEAKRLQVEQPTKCPQEECTHKYSYSVISVDFAEGESPPQD
jgi:hypothetical protein